MATKIILFLTVVMLCSLSSTGQTLKRESMGCVGGTSFGGGISLKQTVGQASNTEVFTGSAVTLRQGFQQPEGMYPGPGAVSCGLQLYPNPVITEAVLQIPLNTNTYSLIISDLLGRIIFKKDGMNTETYTLTVASLPLSQYIIQVIYSDGSRCSTKLIAAHG